MHVTSSVDQEKQLTIITIVGDLSLEKLMEVIKPLYEKRPSKNVLWDVRNASMAPISNEDIQSIVKYLKQHGEVRTGGKSAIVASEDFNYGITRMIKTYSEIDKISFTMNVFRSMEEAVQWLEEDK